MPPKYVIVIPARFKSSRFPGKPLVEIKGKSMIRHVWERCIQTLPAVDVYVATDDESIFSHCHSQGMQVLMTSPSCLTGTDRVYEASGQIDANVFINVQGDEPLLDFKDIQVVIEASKKSPKSVINAMCPIDDEQDFISPTVPKVVARPDGRLLYMSRAGIPTTKEQKFVSAMKQVCIYAFPRKSLEDFVEKGQKAALEAIEDIEILRFLELGYDVEMVLVSQASVAVDVPSDVSRVEAEIDARS